MKRPNGSGTVYKRGSTWTAQITLYTTVDEDGKLHRHYKTKGGFRTKRDALSYLNEIRSSETRKVPTLLELYTSLEKNYIPKLSKNKQLGYRKARERIEPIIHRKIDSLTTSDLQSIISERTFTYYTARDVKTLLSKLYDMACADQFIPSNLSKYIVLPANEEAEAEPFNEDEVSKIWKAYEGGDEFAGYLLIMIYSGMMPGELMDCKRSQIDFDKCEIYGCGKKTKFRKKAVIVFADAVKPVIEDLCKGEKLYPGSRYEFYPSYHEATKRIGIRDLPPYACRHTTGTEAARLGLNASTIQKIMRHTRITTSQRYIHMGEEDAHSGVNSFSVTNG